MNIILIISVIGGSIGSSSSSSRRSSSCCRRTTSSSGSNSNASTLIENQIDKRMKTPDRHSDESLPCRTLRASPTDSNTDGRFNRQRMPQRIRSSHIPRRIGSLTPMRKNITEMLTCKGMMDNTNTVTPVQREYQNALKLLQECRV